MTVKKEQSRPSSERDPSPPTLTQQLVIDGYQRPTFSQLHAIARVVESSPVIPEAVKPIVFGLMVAHRDPRYEKDAKALGIDEKLHAKFRASLKNVVSNEILIPLNQKIEAEIVRIRRIEQQREEVRKHRLQAQNNQEQEPTVRKRKSKRNEEDFPHPTREEILAELKKYSPEERRVFELREEGCLNREIRRIMRQEFPNWDGLKVNYTVKVFLRKRMIQPNPQGKKKTAQ